MTVFFHALQDGRIQILTWNEYLRAMGKRKDWLLGWADRNHILLVKNEHSIGSISKETLKQILEMKA